MKFYVNLSGARGSEMLRQVQTVDNPEPDYHGDDSQVPKTDKDWEDFMRGLQ